jgi:hypothetical protein
MPAWRDANARPDVVANPLHALSAALGREDIKANLRPIVDAFGELDRFVFLMLRPVDAEFGLRASLHRKVAMQLSEQRAWRHRLGGIYLDFVIVLRARRRGGQQRDSREHDEKRADATNSRVTGRNLFLRFQGRRIVYCDGRRNCRGELEILHARAISAFPSAIFQMSRR